MSAYGRCPLTGGLKCRVSVEKLLGPQFGVRLQEVSAYRRCPLTRGLKCGVLVEKLPGLQFGVRLWEVSISGGSTVVRRRGPENFKIRS